MRGLSDECRDRNWPQNSAFGEEALKKEQKIPEPTPEQALEKYFAKRCREQITERRLLTGKTSNNKCGLSPTPWTQSFGSLREALELCVEAFAAIHISVSGRVRTIHVDGYYIRELMSGARRGMRGDFLCMILRVQLVANIVLGYLKLEDYAEAHVWGKRTIVLFRQTKAS